MSGSASHARLLGAAAAVVAAAWAGCPGAKEARMDEAVFGKTERVYVGRFSLEVPAGAKRYGEQYELRELTLTEVDLSPRSDRSPAAEAWNAAWGAKLGAVKALERKRLDPGDIDGKVHNRTAIEPRFELLTYCHENMDDFVTYAALREVSRTGLWLSRVGELSDAAAIRAAIAVVGKAWQPLAPGAPLKGDVFHLPGGAVALPYHEQERADVTYRGGSLDVEVELAMQSVVKPKGGGLMERFGESVLRAGAAMSAGMSVVRNRGRTAAGLKGEEFVMRASEEGKLYFLWEFRGEANSGAKPRIQLQMTTKDERQKEKVAYWDALVDSLRPAANP